MDTAFQIIQVAGLDVEVWLCTANNPTAAEWTQACRAVADLVHARNGDVSNHRSFVVTDGGAPNASQRRELTKETLRGRPVKSAVVTTVVRTNPIKRGIATAIHWLNPEFRVFEPSEVLLALDHIGVTRVQFESIWTTLAVLQGTLAPSETLRLIAGALGLPLQEHRERLCGNATDTKK